MTHAVDLTTYLLFSGAVVMLLLSPGPNMAFVMTHGIAFGPRGGLAAAAGIGFADLVMTLLTVTGVTAVVAAWPASFDVLRYAGTAYLLHLAIQAVYARRIDSASAVTEALEKSVRKVFVKALAGSLINPKPMLFFVIFLPQFVDPKRASVDLQLAIFGLTLALSAFVFHALLGLFSAAMGRSVQRLVTHCPRVARLQQFGLAGVMTALAAYLFLAERPTTKT